jgi:hypothetical protein
MFYFTLIKIKLRVLCFNLFECFMRFFFFICLIYSNFQAFSLFSPLSFSYGEKGDIQTSSLRESVENYKIEQYICEKYISKHHKHKIHNFYVENLPSVRRKNHRTVVHSNNSTTNNYENT